MPALETLFFSFKKPFPLLFFEVMLYPLGEKRKNSPSFYFIFIKFIPLRFLIIYSLAFLVMSPEDKYNVGSFRFCPSVNANNKSPSLKLFLYLAFTKYVKSPAFEGICTVKFNSLFFAIATLSRILISFFFKY